MAFASFDLNQGAPVRLAHSFLRDNRPILTSKRRPLMDTLTRRSELGPSVVPFEKNARVADDLAVARQRMRHLAPWNVTPLPVMHSVTGKPTERLSPAQRERATQLALQILAIQMDHTAHQGALH